MATPGLTGNYHAGALGSHVAKFSGHAWERPTESPWKGGIYADGVLAKTFVLPGRDNQLHLGFHNRLETHWEHVFGHYHGLQALLTTGYDTPPYNELSIEDQQGFAVGLSAGYRGLAYDSSFDFDDGYHNGLGLAALGAIEMNDQGRSLFFSYMHSNTPFQVDSLSYGPVKMHTFAIGYGAIHTAPTP